MPPEPLDPLSSANDDESEFGVPPGHQEPLATWAFRRLKAGLTMRYHRASASRGQATPPLSGQADRSVTLAEEGGRQADDVSFDRLGHSITLTPSTGV